MGQFGKLADERQIVSAEAARRLPLARRLVSFRENDIEMSATLRGVFPNRRTD
jgi:hypothetical protein